MAELKSLYRPKFRPFRVYSEQEIKRTRFKRRAFSTFVLSFIAVVSSIVAYVYYNSFFESTNDGKLFTNTAPLTSKLEGKVSKVFVRETQVVKAGDPLVQFDAREAQNTLDQREAALKRSEDQLEGGKAHLQRLREKLATEDGEALRKQIEDGKAWLSRLQTKTQELREAANEARAQVESTIVKAPSDGYIGPKPIAAGATVSAGQPLLHFVGAGMPWVVASFKEVQLENIRVGQKVDVFLPHLNKSYEGTVESIPPSADPGIAKNKIEGLLLRLMKSGDRVPVKIAFDAMSVGKNANKFINGSAAEVKVYIK